MTQAKEMYVELKEAPLEIGLEINQHKAEISPSEKISLSEITI